MQPSHARRSLKVMADYDCFPIWKAEPGRVGNVDPSSLPISAPLCADLLAWAAVFDTTLDRSDPTRSGFSAPSARAAWLHQGSQLADALQQELGPGLSITYWHTEANT